MKTLANFALLLAALIAIGSPAVAEKDDTPANDSERETTGEKSAKPSADKIRKDNEDELKKDLQKMQGKWQRVPIDNQGFVGKRQEKVIEGNVETLTRYDLDNNVESVHSVEFKLEMSGDVKLFTFAPKGHINDKDWQRSYVYKLDGDIFYDIPGVLVNRRSYSDTPAIYEWTRLRIPETDRVKKK